jgi:GTP-binding protein
VFVLVDSRLSPQKIDLEFINWLGENNIPLGIIFTKADKLKAQESEKNINAFKEALLQYWEALPEIFVSSAQNKLGKTEILNYFAKVLNS